MLAILVALLGTPAFGQDGIPVSIKVVDVDGNVIPSAVVRNNEEKERQRVNMATGVWTGDAIYLDDGTEKLFEKKMVLEFEVSAPGYVNQPIKYIVKRRKNLVVVPLKKMVFELDEEEVEAPSIGFKRDTPRD